MLDGKGTVLYSTTAEPGRHHKAKVLWIRLSPPRVIARVKIYVDASLVRGWPEIDTVALEPPASAAKPPAGEGPPKEEPGPAEPKPKPPGPKPGPAAGDSGDWGPLPLDRSGKPMGTEGKYVDQFDEVFEEHREILEDPRGKDPATVRLAIEELRPPLKRLYWEASHPWVKARKALIETCTKRADAAFGPLQDHGDEDYQRLRAFRLERDEIWHPLAKLLDPIKMQDPDVRAEAKGMLDRLRRLLDAVQVKSNLDYYRQQVDLREMQAKYDEIVAASDDLEEQAGDIDGTLTLIQEQFPYKAFDPCLAPPHTPDRVAGWARKLANWRGAVDTAVKFFAHARKTSIKARSDEFYRYARWFEDDVRRAIDRAIERQREDWREAVRRPNSYMRRIEGTDVWKRHLDNPDWVAEQLGLIDAGIEAARALIAFAEHYDGREEPDPALTSSIAFLEKVRVRLKGGARKAIEAARLPKGTGNAKLRGIAERIMTGLHRPYRGMTVISEIERKEYVDWRRVSDTMLEGTKVVYSVFWVNYAEKQEGKWYICSAKIVKYHRGAENREWHSAGSWRHGQILEENIDK